MLEDYRPADSDIEYPSAFMKFFKHHKMRVEVLLICDHGHVKGNRDMLSGSPFREAILDLNKQGQGSN